MDKFISSNGLLNIYSSLQISQNFDTLSKDYNSTIKEELSDNYNQTEENELTDRLRAQSSVDDLKKQVKTEQPRLAYSKMLPDDADFAYKTRQIQIKGEIARVKKKQSQPAAVIKRQISSFEQTQKKKEKNTIIQTNRKKNQPRKLEVLSLLRLPQKMNKQMHSSFERTQSKRQEIQIPFSQPKSEISRGKTDYGEKKMIILGEIQQIDEEIKLIESQLNTNQFNFHLKTEDIELEQQKQKQKNDQQETLRAEPQQRKQILSHNSYTTTTIYQNKNYFEKKDQSESSTKKSSVDKKGQPIQKALITNQQKKIQNDKNERQNNFSKHSNFDINERLPVRQNSYLAENIIKQKSNQLKLLESNYGYDQNILGQVNEKFNDLMKLAEDIRSSLKKKQ